MRAGPTGSCCIYRLYTAIWKMAGAPPLDFERKLSVFLKLATVDIAKVLCLLKESAGSSQAGQGELSAVGPQFPRFRLRPFRFHSGLQPYLAAGTCLATQSIIDLHRSELWRDARRANTRYLYFFIRSCCGICSAHLQAKSTSAEIVAKTLR